ncbi:esterase/lipase family protein [Cellulomonas soli]
MSGIARRGAAWAADYAWIGAAQARTSLRRGHPGTLTTGDREPVVLLPGIYETWEVMRPLALALHAAGHPVHTVPALGWNGASLAHSARQVTARLDSLGLPHVLLVAHSKGGLIGKLALTDDPDERITGLVAVNTPFAGSVYARWFPTRAVRALSPRDPHVLALADLDHVHHRIVSVFARFDPHVPSGSRLPGATNVEVPVDGHFRLLADPRVHRVVLDALDDLVRGAGR